MRLAIDFDGVVHDYQHPVPGRRMGLPIPGAKPALDLFQSQGHEVIIFTVWGDSKGQKTIADWLNYYQIPYNEITNIKPNADWYIDDKAIRFTNWSDININAH